MGLLAPPLPFLPLLSPLRIKVVLPASRPEPGQEHLSCTRRSLSDSVLSVCLCLEHTTLLEVGKGLGTDLSFTFPCSAWAAEICFPLEAELESQLSLLELFSSSFQFLHSAWARFLWKGEHSGNHWVLCGFLLKFHEPHSGLTHNLSSKVI